LRVTIFGIVCGKMRTSDRKIEDRLPLRFVKRFLETGFYLAVLPEGKLTSGPIEFRKQDTGATIVDTL
jgi:hypothetical protein